MKTLLASILALSVLGATAASAQVGVRIGPVGVQMGHYHWHHHYYGHREWRRDHWRYW
jgi:hypothetical protein